MSRVKNVYALEPLEMYALVVRGVYKTFPNNYLDKESIKVMVRYLILDSYKYTREDVLVKTDHKFFQNHQLGGARKFFNKSDWQMIIYCFPEWDIKYWEFTQINDKNFWPNSDNQRDFVLWVAKNEGVDISTKEGLRRITVPVIYKYGGSKPLQYAGGLFNLLNTVAQDKYKKWEITKMSSWTKQEAIEAIRWLIEEKLQYTPEQVCGIKITDFAKHNLEGMLEKVFSHSILAALESAYPGIYYREGIRGIRYR